MAVAILESRVLLDGTSSSGDQTGYGSGSSSSSGSNSESGGNSTSNTGYGSGSSSSSSSGGGSTNTGNTSPNALPPDINQIIQNTAHPAAFYAALDVLLPAYEAYAVGRKAAYETYNTSIISITADYQSQFDDLSASRQSQLQAANDAYWSSATGAENGLTAAYLGAKTTHGNTIAPAHQAYWAAAQLLQDDFDLQMSQLSTSSGGGSGLTEESLWTTLLTGELGEWESFVAVRESAAAAFSATMDAALTAWTAAMNPAYSTRVSSFASIRASTDAQAVVLNAAMQAEVEVAEQELEDDLADVEADWQLALLDAEQAWLAAIASPGSYTGMTWTGPQNPFAGVGDWLGGVWNGIRNAPQGLFDVWEQQEWDTWRIDCEIFLADKPVTYLLLEHSLQDNPPDIVFPAGHFVTNAIDQSSNLNAIIKGIVDDHKANGPGTYTDKKYVTFSSGDLGAGIHNSRLWYTLTLNPDHTYSIQMALKDDYNFSLSTNYYQYNLTGAGLVVANNMAWAEQHMQVIEEYSWTANLTTKTGNW